MAASHLLARAVPAHRRNLIFSIKQTGVPLGGMAAGLLGPSMAVTYGWQGGLLACAGAAACLCLLPSASGIAGTPTGSRGVPG